MEEGLLSAKTMNTQLLLSKFWTRVIAPTVSVQHQGFCGIFTYLELFCTGIANKNCLVKLLITFCRNIHCPFSLINNALVPSEHRQNLGCLEQLVQEFYGAITNYLGLMQFAASRYPAYSLLVAPTSSCCKSSFLYCSFTVLPLARAQNALFPHRSPSSFESYKLFGGQNTFLLFYGFCWKTSW